MEKTINKKWYFDQSPAEVWNYLTKSDLIEEWLMKNNFKPILGHQFQFTFESKGNQYLGVVNCKVLEIVPHSKLVYSWEGSTVEGDRKFSSVVEWRLIKINNGTELQLSHNGFTVLEDILAHSSGWDACLNKFTNLINTNKQ